MASGGAFYPQDNRPPAAGPAGFTQHPNTSALNVNAYPPPPGHYNPADYTNLPGPPPGPPPNQRGTGGHPHDPYPPTGPENVSRETHMSDSPLSSPINDPLPRGTGAQGAEFPRVNVNDVHVSTRVIFPTAY